MRTPTPQTEGQSTPRSPPIGLSPASRSIGSGPSLSSSALSFKMIKESKDRLSVIGFHHISDTRNVHLCHSDMAGGNLLVKYLENIKH